MDTWTWSLGMGDAQYVRVEVRARPAQNDEYKWIPVRVNIKAGGFVSRFDASFLINEFSRFADELATLDQSLKGKAIFETMEEQLRLEVIVNKLGQVLINGEAMDIAGIGNKLLFHLDLDQSYIPKSVAELRSVVSALSPNAG
jgi:hypothetical protein